MLIKIIMVLLMVSLAHAEWRWANDTSEFTMDKKAHLVGSFGLYYLFRHKEFNETQSILYSISLGLLIPGKITCIFVGSMPTLHANFFVKFEFAIM